MSSGRGEFPSTCLQVNTLAESITGVGTCISWLPTTPAADARFTRTRGKMQLRLNEMAARRCVKLGICAMRSANRCRAVLRLPALGGIAKRQFIEAIVVRRVCVHTMEVGFSEEVQCDAQPFRKALLLIFVLMTSPVLAAPPPERKQGLERIGHIIVLFLENRSFDHLYGLFPGADGIENSGFAAIQVTAEGRQFRALPAVINSLSIWPGSRAMSSGIDTAICHRGCRTVHSGRI